MSIDDKLSRISTLIEVTTGTGTYQGTGFFYNQLAPRNKQGPHYRHIEAMWVVTNRHVLLPEQQSAGLMPLAVTLYVRKLTESGLLIWDPIKLSPEEVENLARFHRNKAIDVAALNILDRVTERVKSSEQYVAPYGLSVEDLPGDNSVDVEVASDIVVVGYPRGYYDKINLFPIVKSGIVASRWGVGFQSNPYFLIDAKLFPGSSGSVVLSKPNDLMVKDGQIMYAKEKRFSLLGIFSGEPKFEEAPVEVGDLIVTHRSGFNLGIVWYGELIEEVISQGVSLSQALAT